VHAPRAPRDAASATWIGHSTVLLQIGGLNVLTDPIFSERAFPVQWMGPRRIMPPALALESLPPLDVVLLTHSHYDHLDKSSAKRLARLHPDATWVAPLALGAYLRGFGIPSVVELDWFLEILDKDTQMSIMQRRMRVKCTVTKKGRQWRITAFEPLALFSLPSAA